MGDDEANFGPFYRKRSNSQTDQVAEAMARSSQLWGRTHRLGGWEPTVQAYVGSLENRVGVEFFTYHPPRPGTPPDQAEWRPGMVGVRVDGEFAKIAIRVTRNTQSERQK